MKNATIPPIMEGRTSVAFSNRKTGKRNAAITGWAFFTASVFAIMGLKLYDPVLTGSDFLFQGAAHGPQVIAGALGGLILVARVCSDAILLYNHIGCSIF